MKMKTILRFAVPVIIIGLGVLITYWLLVNAQKVKQQPRQPRLWNVSAQVAQQKNYHPYILVYGRVKAPQLTQLKSEVVTDVARVFVKKGMSVKVGQVLMKLNPSKLKIEQDQVQAQGRDKAGRGAGGADDAQRDAGQEGQGQGRQDGGSRVGRPQRGRAGLLAGGRKRREQQPLCERDLRQGRARRRGRADDRAAERVRHQQG